MKSDTSINNIDLNNSRIDLVGINPTEKEKVVLVGNPNVGKSCVFNYLSSMYVDVSNFPGTTISITKCEYKNKSVYDTPGIYGVSSFNDEERVAKEIILSADRIINVVNALHLERDLFLTLQLIDMGKKISVLLNFSDELKRRKIKIDSTKLSELLGVEVIETSAVNKTGLDKLEFAIDNAKVGNQQLDLHFMLQQLMENNVSQSEALLILEGDEETAEKNNLPLGTPDDRERIYVNRRNRVNEIVAEVEYEDSKKGEIFNLLGRFSLNPLTGIPILIVMLFIVYLFIGDFVSQQIVDFTENTIGRDFFEYNVKSFVGNFSPVDINVEIFDEEENLVSNKSFSFAEGMNSQPELKNEFNTFSSQDGAVSEFNFTNPIVRLFFGEFGVITMTTTYRIQFY